MYEIRREVGVLQKTQVLVVGGGSAGVAAALMAARNGAEVALLERYNHLGGQATGGLVLLLDGYAEDGITVCRGIGAEIADRLEQRGGLDRPAPGQNGTTDPEEFEHLCLDMLLEAKVEVIFHIWGFDVIMDGSRPRAVVTVSKSGLKAVEADVVIDCSGDGDIYAAAGADFVVKESNIGLPFRIGGIDAAEVERYQREHGKELAEIRTEIREETGVVPAWRPALRPGVGWVNVVGYSLDGLDVKNLTQAEIRCRQGIWKAMAMARERIPGFGSAYILEVACQLGVRTTRMTVTREEVSGPQKDVIGYNRKIEIPYSALLPKGVEGMLTAGRCVLDAVRCIPPCFITGHAAGTAAALSLDGGVPPRELNVSRLQERLREEGAYLGPRLDGA